MRKLFLLGFLVLALVWMPGMAGAYTLTLDIATDGVSSPTNPECLAIQVGNGVIPRWEHRPKLRGALLQRLNL